MTKTKTILAALFALSLTLGVVGCEEEVDDTPAADTPPEDVAEEATEEAEEAAEEAEEAVEEAAGEAEAAAEEAGDAVEAAGEEVEEEAAEEE